MAVKAVTFLLELFIQFEKKSFAIENFFYVSMSSPVPRDDTLFLFGALFCLRKRVFSIENFFAFRVSSFMPYNDVPVTNLFSI